MTTHEHTWVRDPDALAELAASLESHPAHALDTESNSGFVYEERLCLLQLQVAERTWLVDLLALAGGSQALEPLRPALESGEIVTWVHGGEFDVGCLKRDFGIALGGAWDSQQAASFLGWEKTGYGSVAERACNVRVEKGYAHYDWSRRPIPGEALRYAIEDVLYLPAVCGRLVEAIRQADLEEELAIANQAVMDATWGGGYDPDGFIALKGAGRLPARALVLLGPLYRWRDGLARRLDLPPGRVIANRQLVDIARLEPSAADELARLGLARRVVAEHGRTILNLLAEARRSPPDLPPAPPRRPPDRLAAARNDALRGWRRQEARRREVPEQVVLPAAALRHLVEHGAAADLATVPQLGPKRIALYGGILTELCAAP
jgi:ribonuclease D